MVWAVVNVASLFGIIALSLRAVRPDMDRTRLVMWSVVLLGPAGQLDPVRLTLYFGQVNLVLCVLLLADLTTTLRVPRAGGSPGACWSALPLRSSWCPSCSSPTCS